MIPTCDGLRIFLKFNEEIFGKAIIILFLGDLVRLWQVKRPILAVVHDTCMSGALKFFSNLDVFMLRQIIESRLVLLLVLLLVSQKQTSLVDTKRANLLLVRI